MPNPAARRAGTVLLGALALAACSGVPKLPPAPLEPEPTSYTANLPPYRIQVGDVLEVRLLLNPELNEEIETKIRNILVVTFMMITFFRYARTHGKNLCS